jgi:hypothetical protein
MSGKRGVIGRPLAKIKELRVFLVWRYCPLPQKEAAVNPDFMPRCEDERGHFHISGKNLWRLVCLKSVRRNRPRARSRRER